MIGNEFERLEGAVAIPVEELKALAERPMKRKRPKIAPLPHRA